MIYKSAAVSGFTVSASVGRCVCVSKYKYLRKLLLYGCDASRVFAPDYINELLRVMEGLFLNQVALSYDITGDVVLEESYYIKIDLAWVGRDLDDILSAHLLA